MPPNVVTTRERATLIFDGDCGFCTSSVLWLERTIPAMPSALPFQWAPLEDLGLSPQEAAERIWLVTTADSATGGSALHHQYGGHLAVSAILRHQPNLGWRFVGVLLDTPPFSLAAGIVYSLIARFRYLLPGGTPACNLRTVP